MDIPADIAANAAMTRQVIALETIKKNADADKAIAAFWNNQPPMSPH
jgi:hypothetical protein